MKEIAGYKITETLYQGRRSQIFRGVKNEQSVIIKVPSTPYLEAKLVHEFHTGQRISSEHVVKFLELISDSRYGHVLIEEDDGGHSLQQVIPHEGYSPLSFLSIAIQLAEGLQHIHESNVIHKDIKPSNIIRTQGGKVKYIDFNSSLTLRSCQSISKTTEATLAYMSPELTGRINQTVDYRTDFYSLGVTFYQLLCGKLPFPAKSVAELVHSHLAKQVPVPSKINTPIPKPISDIIIKLMEKEPKLRYQSACGILLDLKRCLEELDQKGSITPFVLGQHDIPEYFCIHGKLYGRENEVSILYEACNRINPAAKEIILIGGSAGTGKSTLVQEVAPVITGKGGFFLMGKHEASKAHVPYTSIIEALQSWIQQVLAGSNESILVWKEVLLSQLGNQGQLMIDILHDLQLIIGPQSPLPPLEGEQAKMRFQRVFQRFVTALTKSAPIVLFLDDLHWADPATLDLLETILSNTAITHLLVIATFRSEEASRSQNLMKMMDRLPLFGLRFQTIRLQPLCAAVVSQWIAEAAQRTPEETLPLAMLVCQKTAGCPFFVKVFMQSLFEQGLLAHVAGHWHWNLETIRGLPVTENLISFLIQQIQQLPPKVVDLLQFVSCVGHGFSLEKLIQIQDRPAQDIVNQLSILMEKGLLMETDDEYLFAHDKVQEAVLQQIPKEKELQIHVAIGRRLKSNSQHSAEAVDHLNRGMELITSQSERIELAKLNMVVGKKAKLDIAYASSLTYLKTAESWLHGIDIWKEDYEFAFQFHKQLADVEHLNLHDDESKKYIDKLLQYSKDIPKTMDVYSMLIVHLETRAKFEQAVNVGVQALRMLGLDIDTSNLEATRKELWAQLKPKLDTQTLLNAPQVTNGLVLMRLKMTEHILAAAYACSYLWLDILVATMMDLMIIYGVSNESAIAFTICGMILICRFGEITQGHAFGKLALQLSEKSGNLVTICRCNCLYAGFIHHWKLPLEQLDSYFTRSEQAGEAAGDYQYIGYCLIFKTIYHFQTTIPLQDQEIELKKMLKPYSQNHRPVMAQIQAILFIIKNLQGETPDLSVFQYNNESDEEFLATWKEEKGPTVFVYLVFKAQCLYLHGDSQAALVVLTQAQSYLEFVLSIIPVALWYFYSSLVMLSLYSTVTPQTQHVYREKVQQYRQLLKSWADHCPENFLHKLLIVQAEEERAIHQNPWNALEKYDQVVQIAQKCNSLQDQALIHELSAKFFFTLNKPMCGKGFMYTAIQIYDQWGAKRKVDQLVGTFGHFLPSAGKLSSFISGGETISASALQTLDLTAILKTSQAISSEVDLKNLLSKILKILITTAGAQKASFFIVESGHLLVQAEYNIDGQVSLLQRQPLSEWEHGCQSIVDFVKRTSQPLLLANASIDTRFAQEAYISQNGVYSVLCSPIVRHNELKAILYLENNLTSHVFSEQHMQILTLLGVQIAISLENASYYYSITSLNAQLNLALQSGNVGTWCWYIPSNTVTWDERMYEIFGVERHELTTTGQGWLSLVHPDDVAFVEESAQRTIEGNPLSIEYRIVKKDKTICTIESVGKVILDEQGKPDRIVGVIRDVTARKKLEEERLQALSMAEEKERNRAEEAEKYRTNLENFINQICHEIRNPMCGIFGNVDIAYSTLTCMKDLLDTVPDSLQPLLLTNWETLLQCITQMHQCVKHQKAIVDDVLDLSKLESSQNNLAAVPFSLKSAVQEVAQIFEAPLSLKKVSTILSLPNSDPWVYGDPHRLKLALTNIVSNAVKFTDQGSIKITLELKEVTSSHTIFGIIVEDTGIGMTPEEQSLLFHRFARVAAAEFEGSGLGLYLSKRFVELMGGKIDIQSKKGEGSKFSIVLQLKCAERDTKSDQSVPDPPPIMTPTRILVVEDNVINQRILQRQLEQAGHHCEVAGNGQEALNKWETSSFDLIFMDIEMPVMGGFETTQIIRKKERELGMNHRISIVGLSAFSSPEFVQQAHAAGMDDYITKPYEKNCIREAIARCIKHKRYSDNAMNKMQLSKQPRIH